MDVWNLQLQPDACSTVVYYSFYWIHAAYYQIQQTIPPMATEFLNVHPLCYFDMTDEELQEFLQSKKN